MLCCFASLCIHRLTESTCKLFHIKVGVIVTFNVYRFILIVYGRRLSCDMWKKEWNRTHRRYSHRAWKAFTKHFTQIFHYIHLWFGSFFFVWPPALLLRPFSPLFRCVFFVTFRCRFDRANDVFESLCLCDVRCAYRWGVRRRKRPISHNFSITFTFI